MLDQALESLLRTKLVPTGSSGDNLLEGAYAPISTFSSRIDLTYRIGLISKRFCRDLHVIRKIRNDFAHNVTGCNFERESVLNRITELKRFVFCGQNVPNIRKHFPDTPRGNFQMIVSWMLWYLWASIERLDPLEECEKEWGYIHPDKLDKIEENKKD